MNYYQQLLPAEYGELVEELNAAAAVVRKHALDLDTCEAHPKLDDMPDGSVYTFTRFGIPEEYRRSQGKYDTIGCNEVKRCLCTFTLAYADAASAVAFPGPSLSGATMSALGSKQQQDDFFSHWDNGNPYTFFGVSEAGFGSNAGGMESTLDLKTMRLNGSKKWVGNGTRGTLGVVFARTGPSPLSIRGMLVNPDSPGFSASRLNTAGNRLAAMSELTFDDVVIQDAELLGEHLPASRRGMWGMMRAFLRMRLSVACLAAGTANALIDDLRARGITGLESYEVRARAVTAMILDCAQRRDVAEIEMAEVAACKYVAVELAKDILCNLMPHLPGELWLDPWIDKTCRDIAGFEFMEGTATMQLENIGRGLVRGVKRGL